MDTMYKAFMAYAEAYAAYGRAYRAAYDDDSVEAANQRQQAAWKTFQSAAGLWRLDIGLLCLIQNALWQGLPVHLVDTFWLLCQSGN